MRTKTKLRLNDKVIIITGRDKGKQGFIKKIYVSIHKVLVEGINIVYRHQKPIPSMNLLGGIQRKEALIDISNVSLFYGQDKCVLSKIGYQYIKGNKRRFYKKNRVFLI